MEDLIITLRLVRYPRLAAGVAVLVDHPIKTPTNRKKESLDLDDPLLKIVAQGTLKIPSTELGMIVLVASLLLRMEAEKRIEYHIGDLFLTYFHRWLTPKEKTEDATESPLTCFILEHEGADPDVFVRIDATDKPCNEATEVFLLPTGINANELLLEEGLKDQFLRSTLRQFMECLAHDGEVAWRKARELEKAADSTAA